MKQIYTFTVCGYTYLTTNKKLGVDRIHTKNNPGGLYAMKLWPDTNPNMVFVWKKLDECSLKEEDEAIRSLAE